MSKKTDLVSFVPINRSLFQHFLWKEKRTFSKCEAWLDLIQSARFEQSQARELVGGKLTTWKRGQLPASVRFLATRWGWKSTHKVEDFLKLLKAEGMIKTEVVNGQTIISLLNYDDHNPSGQQKGRANTPPSHVPAEAGDSGGDNRGTAGGQAGDETNKGNKDNNDEEEQPAPALPAADVEKIKIFYNEIKPHWARWRVYRKEQHRNAYKSEDAEATAVKRLYNLSDGDGKTAGEIIDQSIGQGWKGLFELENKKTRINGKDNPRNNQNGIPQPAGISNGGFGAL